MPAKRKEDAQATARASVATAKAPHPSDTSSNAHKAPPKWISKDWTGVIKVDDDDSRTDETWGSWKADDTIDKSWDMQGTIDKSWDMQWLWGTPHWEGTVSHGWRDHDKGQEAGGWGTGSSDAGGWAGSSSDGQGQGHQWQHTMVKSEGQGWTKILSLSSSIHSNLLLVVLLDTPQLAKIKWSNLLSSKKV